MDYLEKINDLLYKFAKVRKSSKLKDKRFRLFLELLGDPQNKFRSIHIAGTSGKGSTAIFISNILTQSGLKVGLNLSPHVQSVTERIQINNHPINAKKLYDHLLGVLPLTKAVEARVGSLSYFEVLTGLAFYIFAKEPVEIAVIEAGIGGSRDVTNILKPKVTILTNVDLDHTRVLGNTVKKIATDKAGIIKPGVPVFTAAKQPSVLKIISEKAKESGSDLYVLGKDFRFEITHLDQEKTRFNLVTTWGNLTNLEIRLPGRFQVENSVLAASAALYLRSSEKSIREGLIRAYIPGRFEVVSKNPAIILDGAHNPAKISALLSSVNEIYPEKETVTLMVPKKDRDMKQIIDSVLPFSQKIFLTQLKDTSIPSLLNKTADYIKERGGQKGIIPNSPEAFETISKELGEHQVLVVTGSFYLVGEIKKFLKSP